MARAYCTLLAIGQSCRYSRRRTRAAGNFHTVLRLFIDRDTLVLSGALAARVRAAAFTAALMNVGQSPHAVEPGNPPALVA